MSELNLDLGDGMNLSVRLQKDMDIMQFRAIADKVVKIAKIIERQSKVASQIRSGNGHAKRKYNGGKPRKSRKRNIGFGARVLATMKVGKKYQVQDLAKQFGVKSKKITDVMAYNKRKGIIKHVGRGEWVKVR